MQTQRVRENIESDFEELNGKNKFILDRVVSLTKTIRKELSVSGVIESLSRAAEELEQYFRFEESYLQKKLDSVDFLDHRERHDFFVDFLRTPILSTSDDGNCNMDELCDFIIDWLTFHVRHLDKNAFTSASCS